MVETRPRSMLSARTVCLFDNRTTKLYILYNIITINEEYVTYIIGVDIFVESTLYARVNVSTSERYVKRLVMMLIRVTNITTISHYQ